MCCFTKRVESVRATSIFTRHEGGRQYVAYAMRLTSQEDVAMVLPLPVLPGTKEDELEFVSLEPVPDFFARLKRLFRLSPNISDGVNPRTHELLSAPRLAVHEVGLFEASFVPRRSDFGRLDSRFRLPTEIWNDAPEYADYGFAVFQLKAGTNVQVHPMAFSFPTRFPQMLVFPTLHIHDGQYHPEAHFDHELFFQAPELRTVEDPKVGAIGRLRTSHGERILESNTTPITDELDLNELSGLFNEQQRCYKFDMVGRFQNSDVRVREES